MPWPKGKPQSEEHRRKNALAQMGNQRAVGQVWSADRRAAVAEKMRGNAYRRGKSRPVSVETRRNISAAKIGKKRAPFSTEARQHMSAAHMGNRHSLGTTRTLEQRQRISERHKGHGNPNYRDGRAKDRRDERLAFLTRPAYRAFRKAVLERDGHRCVTCGSEGPTLHVDHIKPWRLYPELRFEVTNGRTICPPCHRKTETFGMKAVMLAR